MKSVFEGICTALVTPFKDNKVDYQALEKLIEFQISGGVSAISILGTTGEPCTITNEERKEIIVFCKHIINNRVKFIVGTGGNNTLKVLKDSEFASSQGADGLLVVTPYYNKCTQNGLVKYYQQIAQFQTPIIAYNVPSRTGLNILPQTLNQIATNKYVYGFKQANVNMSENLQIFQENREKIAIYSGEDALNYVFYMLGGYGAISVTANAYPKTVAKIYNLAKAGKTEEALKLQEQLASINSLLFSEVNPIPIKECLCQMNLCKNELRLPLTKMENNKPLIKEMKRLKKELVE